MNVYEMEGFLRGKCLPGDLLVGESHAAYLVRKLNESATLKADRDAQQKRADALAVENEAMREAIAFATAPDMWIEQHDGMLDYRYSEWYVDVLNAAVETPATSAALAAIEARGVDKYAIHQRERAEGLNNRNNKLAEEARGMAADAEDFAAWLREAK